MKKGLVILLNGPSSGGKTTLSRNLQKHFPAPLYYNSYDLTLGEMIPYIDRYCCTNPETGGVIDPETEFLTVMYVMARAVSDMGRNIVVDNCFFDTQEIYESAREILRDNPVILVRVKCPLEELRRREKARGNRTIGKAEWQEAHIKPKEDSAYDIIVDTHAEKSEVCAERIIALCMEKLGQTNG